VLTNRNLGGYEIQAIGHGDLIQDNDGNWWIIHLGFRQVGQWIPYHHLGREVFLAPVTFHEDGWFTAGHNGTTRKEIETDRITEHVIQQEKKLYTFGNTKWELEWVQLRHPRNENYKLEDDRVTLTGTAVTLDQADTPTFLGIRQRDFKAAISSEVALTNNGEAGITLYMDESHHYDLAIRHRDDRLEAVLRLNIGDVKHEQKVTALEEGQGVKLLIHAEALHYSFSIQAGEQHISLGTAQTKYLSSEVAGGFTGVLIGLYAVGEGAAAEFTEFVCEYL
jgi:alpha-N-arabinofuranosidase